MNRLAEQKLLLEIVETWNLKEKPEFRGFRCANCQEYKDQAWYHWLNTENYKLPVHLCDDKCETLFSSNKININKELRKLVDRKEFGKSYKYSNIAVKQFREIINSWLTNQPPKLKQFYCDNCQQTLEMVSLSNGSKQRQGYHVWWKMDDGITLVELHFDRKCASELGIND